MGGEIVVLNQIASRKLILDLPAVPLPVQLLRFLRPGDGEKVPIIAVVPLRAVELGFLLQHEAAAYPTAAQRPVSVIPGVESLALKAVPILDHGLHVPPKMLPRFHGILHGKGNARLVHKAIPPCVKDSLLRSFCPWTAG